MQKNKVLEIFKNSHELFQDVLNKTTDEQRQMKVVGWWTIKEVIAHLSAWNWEQVKEIENVLGGKPTWEKRFETKADEDRFNAAAVEARKSKELLELITEWEDSFGALMGKIEELSLEQWRVQGMQTLFEYETGGYSDEGLHAKQINEFLNI